MTKRFSDFSLHSQRKQTSKGNQASETDASVPDTQENAAISMEQPIESQSGAQNDEPKMQPQTGQKVERISESSGYMIFRG